MRDSGSRPSDNRLRVAIIAQSLDDGGLEKLVRDLALGLDRNKFEPGVFALRELGIYATDLEEANIPVRFCPEPRIRIRGIPGTLIKRLFDFRPDIIHAQSGTWFSAAVAKIVLRRPKLVFTEHGRYPPEPRLRAVLERWCAKRTSIVTAVSGAAAQYLRDFLDLPSTPRVLPNGIDLDTYRARDPETRAKLRSEWDIEDHETLFAFVGRMVPVKNHAGLLRALACLEKTSGVRAAFFGQGPLEQQVRDLAASLGMLDRVRFLGFRTDIPACLHASDAFVLPSTTEGMPVSLLEALAAGLPIVASDVGGVSEVLGQPPAGILVPSGDTRQLAEAMARLAGSRGLRDRLAIRAKERSEAFGLEAFATRYAEVYREAARSLSQRRS